MRFFMCVIMSAAVLTFWTVEPLAYEGGRKETMLDVTRFRRVDPWKTLTRIAPGLQYYHEFNDKWGVWPQFAAISGFENEDSLRSWTYNPQCVGFYMHNQQMIIYGGIGMLYHSVDSEIYPMLGVAWNMDSKTGLSSALGFPETMMRYGFDKRLALIMDF